MTENKSESLVRQIEEIDRMTSRAVKGLKVISLSKWKDAKKRRQGLVNDLTRKDKK